LGARRVVRRRPCENLKKQRCTSALHFFAKNCAHVDKEVDPWKERQQPRTKNARGLLLAQSDTHDPNRWNPRRLTCAGPEKETHNAIGLASKCYKQGMERSLILFLAVGALVLAALACSNAGVFGAGSDAGMLRDGSVLTSTERCGHIVRSIEEAGFGAAVTVSCAGTYASIVSDTVPDHVLMNGITGTNDQVPVPAPGYTSPIALSPVRAAAPTSIDAALGVAVNGVPIYDYSAQGNNDLSAYDPKLDTKLTGELDVCNGHAGRGDDYHYHAAPTCMISAMKNKGPSAILGWGFDGYPIYGDQNPDGSTLAAGELDVCNAIPDATFGMRYHTSTTHPYILQCLVGEVDLTKAPRVAPLSKQGGGGKPPGEKPQGGVTNLELATTADGTRTMTYVHNGQSYSIQYKPAATAGCFDFEEKSFTTGGVLTKSTYCRSL
jgi:hypothetical protein